MTLLHITILFLLHVIAGTIAVGVLDRSRELDYDWSVKEVLFVIFGWPLLLLIDFLVRVERFLSCKRRSMLVKKRLQRT